MDKLFKSPIFIGVVSSIMATALVGIFIFLVGIRDTIKYTQPTIDKIQNDNIHHLNESINGVMSLAKEKNRHTNKRIDNMIDGWHSIERKVDSVLINQKILDRRQKFIFKEVRELQPYQNIVEKQN